MHTIRQAELKDKEAIISFIDTHWKKDHAFVKSEKLFDFHHLNKNEGKYHFLVAENDITKEIEGIIGYIPTFYYDPDLFDDGLFWTVIWKIKPEVSDQTPMVGLKLSLEISRLPACKIHAAVGIGPMAEKIYRGLRYKMGYLAHYYILNNERQTFYIAKNVIKNFREEKKSDTSFKIETIDITSCEEVELAYYPRKTRKYLINRYLNHPIYTYQFLGIFDETKLRVILVVREIIQDNTKILRIIDAVGEMETLPDLYHQFQELLKHQEAEYIDMLNYGIDPESIIHIGFERLDIDGDVIIPNYFEPYENRNVRVDFAYKGVEKNYVIFKGDSDQDRPNLI